MATVARMLLSRSSAAALGRASLVAGEGLLPSLRNPVASTTRSLVPGPRWTSSLLPRHFSADADAYPPHLTLDMPSLSPTMSQGNIAEWKKAEGDQVRGWSPRRPGVPAHPHSALSLHPLPPPWTSLL